MTNWRRFRDMNLVRALSVFVTGVLLDVVWAHYTMAIQDRRAWTAAGFAASILLFGAVGITAYVDNAAYLVPAAAGAATGTYWAVKHKR